MARTSVIVAGREFPSKSAGQEAAREVLRRHPRGTVDLAGDDLDFALGLLDLHPQADYFRRNGVAGVCVKAAEGYSTRCFAVIGHDGSREEFSFRVALGISKCQPFLGAAARNLLSEQMLEFKRAAFARGPVLCATSGIELSMRDAHVDHAPPWTFDAITREFDRLHPGVALRHEGTKDFFAHEDDAMAFRALHDLKAVLRIVHRRENLSTLRR